MKIYDINAKIDVVIKEIERTNKIITELSKSVYKDKSGKTKGLDELVLFNTSLKDLLYFYENMNENL